MENPALQKLLQNFNVRFRVMTDEQLINVFNAQVGNATWTSERGAYINALHREFDNRNYDYSALGGPAEFSLKCRIKLVGKKIELDR